MTEMNAVVVNIDADDLLLYYSEWLDGNQLMRDPVESEDTRTHEELVQAFLAETFGATTTE